MKQQFQQLLAIKQQLRAKHHNHSPLLLLTRLYLQHLYSHRNYIYYHLCPYMDKKIQAASCNSRDTCSNSSCNHLDNHHCRKIWNSPAVVKVRIDKANRSSVSLRTPLLMLLRKCSNRRIILTFLLGHQHLTLSSRLSQELSSHFY